MKLLALNCNNCGAPLEVPKKAKFITCTFCGTQLSVQRSGGAFYTEALEELGERTEKLVDDVEVLRLQAELDRLDRKWTEDRERLMLRDQYGKAYVPTKSIANASRVVLSVIGIIFISIPLSCGLFSLPAQDSLSSGLLTLVFTLMFCMPGALLLFLGWIFGKSNLKKVKAYEEARDAHETRRRELMTQIEGLAT